MNRKEKLVKTREEKLNSIYSFIEEKARTYPDLKDTFTPLLMSEKTMCIVLKKLLKEGKILKKSCNGSTLYSVCDDARFTLLAELISVYDKKGTRVQKLAENWDTLHVKDLVEDEDEIVARVQSLTDRSEYHNVQINDDKFICDCDGYIFHNKPCTHILKLVLHCDKISWLMNWVV